MKVDKSLFLRAAVFLLVTATFTNIYVTQPVLPWLAREFSVNETRASLTISLVILGITLANLPFGMAADRYRTRPLIIIGGSMVAICGLICAATTSLNFLVFFRFLQGLFIPAVTTCLVAYLSRSLPVASLNVVMGSYIAATVAGGLGGRLLGGLLHQAAHWRHAFITAALFLAVSLLILILVLPAEEARRPKSQTLMGFPQIIRRTDILKIYLAAFSSFFVFSSIFNYLPFYLNGPPFYAPTQIITWLYLAYLTGIVIAPLTGALSNRLGNGPAMAGGSLIFGLGLSLTLIKSMWLIAMALVVVCAGFFAVHSSAVGSLNLKLTGSQGRGNALYVLFYYLGGYAGITVSGLVYVRGGWPLVVVLGLVVLLAPFFSGITDREGRKSSRT